MKVPSVGPVKVAFDNRLGFVGALVLGDEVRLGAVPMDDLDLVVMPSTQQDTANPPARISLMPG
jgi:hypothetical protein